MRIVYNIKNEENNRVSSIDVLTIKKNIPRYEPLDPNKYYKFIVSSFIADGGDGFDILSKYKKNHKYAIISRIIFNF